MMVKGEKKISEGQMNIKSDEIKMGFFFLFFYFFSQHSMSLKC